MEYSSPLLSGEKYSKILIKYLLTAKIISKEVICLEREYAIREDTAN